MSVPTAQLSCEQCRQRKTKCSKTVPCSACIKANIACTAVQRHRLPRGRSGKKANSSTVGSALKDRVQRLEALVTQLQSQHQPATSNQQPTISTPLDPPSVDSFLAPDFWTELSTAVDGLKEVLEHGDMLEQPDDDRHFDQHSHQLLWESPSSSDGNGPLSHDLRDWLLDVYKERVDCLFKPVHWPTAVSAIRALDSGHQHEQSNIGVKALENAICFTSTSSLLDHEFEGRRPLLSQLRQATEEALTEAGLLTTTSLTVLQAFVIYLAGVRASQSNAQQWTLTALAVRIANAQGIPSSFSHVEPSVDADTRQRVWHCIGVLDLQSAFDRGSRPLLGSSELTMFPMNIDDSELQKPQHGRPLTVSQSRWTDMSLSLMTYHAGVCQRQLSEIGFASAVENGLESNATMEKQIAILNDFEYYKRQLTDACGSSPSLLQRYTIAVAEESHVAMSLLIRRPLHRRRNLNHLPVGESSFNVLQTATEVLERSHMKRTQQEFAPWAWFQWVKWYALAVVLAELCCPVIGPLADRAWKVAHLSYDDYAKDVADTKTGLLWKPIVRLMRKVQQLRAPGPSVPTNHNDLRGDSLGVGPGESGIHRFEESRPEEGSTAMYFDSAMMPDVTEDSAWIHWDMLISDFDDPNMFDS